MRVCLWRGLSVKEREEGREGERGFWRCFLMPQGDRLIRFFGAESPFFFFFERESFFFLFLSLFALLFDEQSASGRRNKTLFLLHHPRSLSLFPTPRATQESLCVPLGEVSRAKTAQEKPALSEKASKQQNDGRSVPHPRARRRRRAHHQ